MVISSNKKLVQLFIEQAWNHGRFNLLENIVQKDFLYTNNYAEQAMTYVGFCHYVAAIRQAIPDLQVEIEDIIAEDDRLVSRTIFHGTPVKSLFGIEPNGKILSLAGYSFWQVERHKIKSLNTIADLSAYPLAARVNATSVVGVVNMDVDASAGF